MESNRLQFTKERFWRSIFCFHSQLKCCTFKSVHLTGNQRQKAQTAVICNNLSAQRETTVTPWWWRWWRMSSWLTPSRQSLWWLEEILLCFVPAAVSVISSTSIPDGRQRDSALWMEEKKLPHTVHLWASSVVPLWWRPSAKPSWCLSRSLFVSIHVWAVWMDSDPPPADHLPTRSARSPTGGRAWSL